MNVAITGALKQPRAAVAAQIDASLNGKFVESLTLDTHYLVCEKHDSKKARKAALYGTTVIGEAELEIYLGARQFPPVGLPDYIPQHPNNIPQIAWSEVFEPARVYRLTYRDSMGNISVRSIAATGRGSDGTYEWIGAFDGPAYKTFRVDRIMSMEAGSR